MIHIVDIDSRIDRKVQYDGANQGDGWATAWSPDGTMLLFSRWSGTENHLAVGSVEGGRGCRDRARATPTAPTGRLPSSRRMVQNIIAQYGQNPDETWLLDVAGGPGERLLTDVSADR